MSKEEPIRIKHKSTYQCYRDMKGRCFNKNSRRYYTHGQRGITVCERWLESFENFIEDMGVKPEGYTIDRKDNDGNYELSNCRWATPKEQGNNRRTNVNLSFGGNTQTIQKWSEELGVSFSVLWKRLKTMPLEKVLSSEMYGNQIISLEKKIEILTKLQSGKSSQNRLAKEYGLSQATISRWVAKNKGST